MGDLDRDAERDGANRGGGGDVDRGTGGVAKLRSVICGERREVRPLR